MKSINSVPLEIENIDDSDEKTIVHDSSIEVSYHQSAAQVLKLIEDLEYRLKSREQLLDKLRRYVETNGEIPNITEIEIVLVDVTSDQIATHFDSYFWYVQTAEPSYLDYNHFKDICVDYINTYYKKYHTLPSFRAISLDSKYNNLVMYSEADLKQLLGEEKEMEQYIIHQNIVKDIPSEAPSIQSFHNKNLENDDSNNEILRKYSSKVTNIHDLNSLSENEKREIKNTYISLFYFLNILNRRRFKCEVQHPVFHMIC